MAVGVAEADAKFECDWPGLGEDTCRCPSLSVMRLNIDIAAMLVERWQDSQRRQE